MSVFKFCDLIFEELTFPNFYAKNKENLIVNLSNILEEKGFVRKGFANAVLEREKEFPTGLPTNILKVAIPHAIDTSFVETPSIVIARLNSPVTFGEMGSLENTVEVDMVLLLAVKGDKSQLEILQRLLGVFCEEEQMLRLKAANTSKDIYNLFKEFTSLEQSAF